MKQKGIQFTVAIAVLAALVALVGCSSAPVATTTSGSEAKATSTSASATASSAAASSATASKAESSATNASQAPSNNQSNQQAPAVNPQPTIDTSKLIDIETAKNTALNDSKVDPATIYDLDVELDFDGGIPHYEVDFNSNGMEYDYIINAETGEILMALSGIDG